MQLRCGEIQECYKLAVRRFEDLGVEITQLNQVHFDLEWQYQFVAKMALRPDTEDPKAKLFANANEVREELTPNEVNWIIDHHNAIQEEQSRKWGSKAGPLSTKICRLLKIDPDATDEDIIAAIEARI